MYKGIIWRYFEGKTSPEEEQILLSWINEDISNLEYYLHERRLYDSVLINEYGDNYSRQVSESFEKIQKQIDTEQDKNAIKGKMVPRILKKIHPMIRYAAIFILGLITYAAFSTIIQSVTYPSWNELEIPKGNRVRVELPDKSIVWLNSQTRFRYPEKFTSQKREVWLDGEAFFEVHKDPKSRFIVHTAKLSIEALGTSFNVLAYDNENILETALVTGKISINYEDSRKSVRVLQPKELLVYNKTSNSLNVRNVDVAPYTSWKNGEFKFINERLDVIVQKLERYYNLRIEFGDDQIKEYRLTGTFPVTESWEKILTVIVKSTNTKYRIINNIAILENANNHKSN